MSSFEDQDYTVSGTSEPQGGEAKSGGAASNVPKNPNVFIMPAPGTETGPKVPGSGPPKQLKSSLVVPSYSAGSKTPPPVLTKTYGEGDTSKEVTVTMEPIGRTTKKRAKVVRFDPNVKTDDSPPPVPRRGMEWGPTSAVPEPFPEATFMDNDDTVATEDLDVATKGLALSQDTVEQATVVGATEGKKVEKTQLRRRHTPPLVRQVNIEVEEDLNQ